MSLSQQKLAANPPSLPTWTASNQLGQAMEPQYMYTSKQLPFMQLERLLDQLSSLSTFANTLFLDLANQTIMIQERLTKAGEQLKKIHDTIPQQVNEPKMGTRTPWTSDASMSSNLFVKATQPKSIKVLYDKCRQAPRLELLDQFRTDGKTCMELYSYPEFFVNEWKLWIEKEKVDRKKKRKEANQETLIDIQMPKAERARIKVETKEAAKHEQQLHFEAPKLAAPPPPPPPPPMLTPAAPTPASTAIQATPETPMQTGFLKDIRANQFQLRKTEAPVVDPKKKKKMNEGSDVAAILMRRAAVEASDSEQGNSFNLRRRR